MSISVVIPCYRSAGTLPPLVERLLPALAQLTDRSEVILVVDGSPDDTWDVASALAARHESVRAILLSRNYGQHNALVAGVRLARYEVTVTMDDDLQHRPEEIQHLVTALHGDDELVYGIPRVEEHGWLRSLASRSVKLAMSRSIKLDGVRDISAFRAFHTYLRDSFEHMTGPLVSLDVALSWATTRATSVIVEMDHREHGTSNYTVRMLVRHALNMLLGFSIAPLRVAIYLGLVCGVLGVVLFTAVIISYFTHHTTVAGFTTMAAMVAIFAGAQMLALGVIGEYVGRLHQSGSGRPMYVVRKRSDADAHPDVEGEPRIRTAVSPDHARGAR